MGSLKPLGLKSNYITKPTTQNILNLSRPIKPPKPKTPPEIFYKRVDALPFQPNCKTLAVFSSSISNFPSFDFFYVFRSLFTVGVRCSLMFSLLFVFQFVFVGEIREASWWNLFEWLNARISIRACWYILNWIGRSDASYLFFFFPIPYFSIFQRFLRNMKHGFLFFDFVLLIECLAGDDYVISTEMQIIICVMCW